MSICQRMSDNLREEYPVGRELPLHHKVREYLDLRRAALSSASVRAHDSAHKHLTWIAHANQLSGVVDRIAWELFYTYHYGHGAEALNALIMEMSDDPARPYVRVIGYADMEQDGKATPAAVAYAHWLHEHESEESWDLTELPPPQLTISHEDITENMAKAMNSFKGEEVELA